MLKLYAAYKAYEANRDGATAIEYGLIAAAVSLAIAGLLFSFGNELKTVFSTLETDMKEASART